jgi:hypothetical protein
MRYARSITKSKKTAEFLSPLASITRKAHPECGASKTPAAGILKASEISNAKVRSSVAI